MPADDFDIVVGKYLAAAAIFTVSLLFSQLSSLRRAACRSRSGNLDSGLLFTTYLGYWFMGLAMLSMGMVASFLTSNLTVGFILGTLFNVPLVVAKRPTTSSLVARSITRSQWSMAAQFDDFGRGVISLASSSLFYSDRGAWHLSEHRADWPAALVQFLRRTKLVARVGLRIVSLITGFGVMAYLLYIWSGSSTPGLNDMFSRIVVRRRCWATLIGLTVGLTSVSLVSVIVGFVQPEWIRRNMFDQYVVRAMSLARPGVRPYLLPLQLRLWPPRHDPRQGEFPLAANQQLVANLGNQYPIVIDAYLSADMPERYAKTKYDLLSLLKEFKSLAGTGIQVNIHDNLERASEEAREAEDQYGITPRPVTLCNAGRFARSKSFWALACGADWKR